MTRVILLMLVLGFEAWAQDPGARASLATKGDLWVGQRITVAIELLAPGYFAGAPVFDLPNAPGMLILPPGESPTVSSESNHGVDYTVQRHELSVVARRAGMQEIPPISIRFRFKRQPLDKDSLPATVQTVSLKLVVKAPPGAERLNQLISARKLSVTEEWKPDTKQAKVGDALTRTVIYSAPDVPSMLFPPFPAAEIEGMGVYRKTPEVLDQADRGELQGKRTEVITYVCKRAGAFTIPATRLTWWDMDAGQLRVIELPERVLQVSANPAMARETGSGKQPARYSAREIAGMGGLALAIMGAFWGIWSARESWMRPFRAVHLAPLNPTQTGPLDQ